MRKLLLSILGIIFLLGTTNVLATSQHFIRLAVFDNPQPDPSSKESSEQFKESYLAGINTAISVAASKGFFITEKEFFHKNNLASVIQEASNAKAWDPEIIMGLSNLKDFISR